MVVYETLRNGRVCGAWSTDVQPLVRSLAGSAGGRPTAFLLDEATPRTKYAIQRLLLVVGYQMGNYIPREGIRSLRQWRTDVARRWGAENDQEVLEDGLQFELQ